jgi:anti-anti-sigma factor
VIQSKEDLKGGRNSMSTIKNSEDSVVVKPGKNLVASVISEFSDELKALTKSSPKEIIIDLEGVDMVDSLGMGILIATHNSLLAQNAVLRVVNVNPDIYNAFVVMRLNHHFEITKAEGS